MKKVFNKKVYNTETAIEVADVWNGHSVSNFDYLLETLYITKKGLWFLHGEGGANTKYLRYVGNGSCWGQKIIPFSVDDAYDWCEKNDQIETIEKYFSSEIEDA